MKTKLFKNLYQSISSFLGVFIIDLALLCGYIVSVSSQPNYGWVLLVIIISITLLFFVIGGYWIFQKVIIDENGIKIFLFSKIIKNVGFEEIDYYKITNVFRNPAITIYLKNQKKINLDERKKIKECLNYYNIRIEYDSYE